MLLCATPAERALEALRRSWAPPSSSARAPPALASSAARSRWFTVTSLTWNNPNKHNRVRAHWMRAMAEPRPTQTSLSLPGTLDVTLHAAVLPGHVWHAPSCCRSCHNSHLVSLAVLQQAAVLFTPETAIIAEAEQFLAPGCWQQQPACSSNAPLQLAWRALAPGSPAVQRQNLPVSHKKQTSNIQGGNHLKGGKLSQWL